MPKVTDVVSGVLTKMNQMVTGEVVEQLVLDFSDVLFKVPNRPDERQWFVACFRGKLIVWRRIAQGCVNGPQAWGRLSALVGRLTASV